MSNRENKNPMNFNILGIGRTQQPTIPPEVAKKISGISHPTQDDTFYLGSVDSSAPKVPSELMNGSGLLGGRIIDGSGEILGEQPATVETPQVDENPEPAYPVAFSEAEAHGYSDMDADRLNAAIQLFSTDIVSTLEKSVSALHLSTGDLFGAGLRVAINLSLMKLLGLKPNAEKWVPAKLELPSEEYYEEHRSSYLIFDLISMIRDDYNGTDFLRQYSDDLDDGIDPEWEDILNLVIAEKTQLTADDSITITDLLAKTWCDLAEDEVDDEQDDQEVDLHDFLNNFRGFPGHDHADGCCCDDEDDDEYDEDPRISVILESNDDGPDCITVCGIDNREMSFFVDFTEMLKTIDRINVKWDFLRDMMPALIFETRTPGMYLRPKLASMCDIKIIDIGDTDDGKKLMGLYYLEEDVFTEGHPDSNDIVAVLDLLFRRYVTGTPLSQLERVMLKSEDFLVQEEEVIEMLEHAGIDIKIYQRDDEVVIEDEHDDVSEDEPGETAGTLVVRTDSSGTEIEETFGMEVGTSDHQDGSESGADLSEIGCEVAEMLKTQETTETQEAEEVPVVTEPAADTGASGDIIFHPVRKKNR